ncbi:MAG: phosphatase PAP2 family protein [candidate division Zixibacteria bacterium]|nr:phosphatase PAP2 family protein [candidate division Zixibacteria bacterium]
MIEFLSQIDTALFLFMNVTLANPVTDLIMPVITSDWLLRILYAIAVVLLLIFGNARLRWVALFSVLVLVVTDQVSAGLLKPMIGRLRPCQTLQNIHLLVNCGGGKSMPSSHAANAFGQAVLFSVIYSRWAWPLLVFAALVALSRVFVGVHYPFDILVGAIIGAAVGYIGAWSVLRYLERRSKGV